jgi:hypothetical protein
MPLYRFGVLYVSNTAGRLQCIDAWNGNTKNGSPTPVKQALVQTFVFGSSALSDVARDWTTDRIYVTSADGKLYAISHILDPNSSR